MSTEYRKYNSETVRMTISIPNEVRELSIQAAKELDIPLAQFISAALREFARDTIGLPKPPPAAAAVPTVSDVLRAYVAGESRLIGPCGKAWPCEYESSTPEKLNDWEFCGSCGIRTR